jgi:hypothetical protein
MWHISRRGDVHIVLSVGNLKEEAPERPRRRCENIKMDFTEVGWEYILNRLV